MDIAVIGLGLIGGSLVRALAAGGHAVTGYDADPATRDAAAAAGDWRIAGSVAEAAQGAEVVVLAVPLPAVRDIVGHLAAYRGLVTDVTSVKAPVRDLAAGLRYVGGHPMAGRETSGFAAGDAALFDGCAWVLCLEPDTSLPDWLTLAAVFTGLGARVVPATAEAHDAAVARISHLPHLVAAALATATADPLCAALAAGSFRDGTRVAAAPPALVASICGGNAGPLAAALDDYLPILAKARAALDSPDPIAALQPWLTPGYAARTAWPPRPAETLTLPATREALLALGTSGGHIIAVDTDTVTAARP